jgi:hypothetical protein
MRKWNLFTGLIVLAALTGCSYWSTVPTRRVHSAASIPRYVDTSTVNFREGNPVPVGVNAGLAHGIAFSDVGNVHDATIFQAGVHFRRPRFAVGFMPYLGVAHPNHEGQGVFGSVLWYAIYFDAGEDWKLSAQNAFTAANKVAEDKGCANDKGNIFFSDCSGSTVSTTRAEVKVRDVGVTFTAEKRLGENDSLLVAPSLYWTWVSTSNRFDSDAPGNYAYRTHFWSPGLQAGYVMRFGGRFKMLTTALIGVHSVKSFRPDKAERMWMPTANVRFQF